MLPGLADIGAVTLKCFDKYYVLVFLPFLFQFSLRTSSHYMSFEGVTSGITMFSGV